jgi:hypothetical protein
VIREASDEDVESTLENQDRNAAMEKTAQNFQGTTLIQADLGADVQLEDPFKSP